MATALNRGLQLARGQYIGKQDADDLCCPSRLRAQVELLDSRPDAVLVSANFSNIDSQGRWAGDSIIENPPALFPYLFIFSNAAAGAGSQGMLRLETARELGGFCEGFEASIDYEFWTRLVRRGSFVILPQIGLIRRLHAGQVSSRLEQQQLRNSLAISRRMLSAHLNRTISEEELTAVVSIWRLLGYTGVAATGNRILCEAYARFIDAESNARLRRKVRRITASRLATSALLLVRRGSFGEALLQLIHALRWHPRGLVDGISFAAHRLSVRLSRKWHAHT
jgi:glycosyltransferase involved in cell wall biosynthesis